MENLAERRRVFQLKHKEVENLKFQDQGENMSAINMAKFKDNIKMDEKAIALTMMNCEKR